MTVHPVRLPDVGEGVAEAELVRWLVAVGDTVGADTPVAEVMTDKATVELYAGIAGTVATRRGEPGDSIAVGSDLMSIESDAAAVPTDSDEPTPAASSSMPAANPFQQDGAPGDPPDRPTTTSGERSTARPTAAPAVRKFARDRDVDLRDLRGSGPDGRILRDDVERHVTRAGSTNAGSTNAGSTRAGSDDASHETPIIGLRRRIAAQVSTSATRIPHITYVEEVDVTELESLREALRSEPGSDTHPALTPLPFIVRAVVRALRHPPGAQLDLRRRAGCSPPTTRCTSASPHRHPTG